MIIAALGIYISISAHQGGRDFALTLTLSQRERGLNLPLSAIEGEGALLSLICRGLFLFAGIVLHQAVSNARFGKDVPGVGSIVAKLSAESSDMRAESSHIR